MARHDFNLHSKFCKNIFHVTIWYWNTLNSVHLVYPLFKKYLKISKVTDTLIKRWISYIIYTENLMYQASLLY